MINTTKIIFRIYKSFSKRCLSNKPKRRPKSNSPDVNMNKKKMNSKVITQEFPDNFEESNVNLMNWLAKHGGQFLDRVGITLNGVFATKKVIAGSNVIAVPTKLCFNRENLVSPKALNCSLANHLPWQSLSLRTIDYPFFKHPKIDDDFYIKDLTFIQERALVALCLMYEYSLKMDSDWGPWLALLPEVSDIKDDSTFIGGPTIPYKYLHELRGTQAFQEIVNMKIDFDGAWNYIEYILDSLPPHISKTFNQRHFDHFMMIASQQYPMHPPAISFIQDAKSSYMANVEKRIYETLSSEGPIELVGLHATRDIDAGEELFLDFKLSGSQTFARYGFAKPASEYDRYTFALPELNLTEDQRNSLEYMINGSVPTCRDIKWDKNLEEAYKKGDTWNWFSKKCGADSDALSPAGKNFEAELGYSYPPNMLIAMCFKSEAATEDETEELNYRSPFNKRVSESYSFMIAKEFVDARLKRLKHVDLEKDKKELREIFSALDKHFREEFSYLYDDNTYDYDDDNTEMLAQQKSAEIPPNVKDVPSIENKNVEISSGGYENGKVSPAISSTLTFYSPPGENVADIIRRDVLYLRYAEKTFFQWLSSHLEECRLEIDQTLLSVPNTGADPAGSFVGAMESLRPTTWWLDQIHRWMHPDVRERYGIVSPIDNKRMREMFRLNEEWRAATNKMSEEESTYLMFDEPAKDGYLNYEEKEKENSD